MYIIYIYNIYIYIYIYIYIIYIIDIYKNLNGCIYNEKLQILVWTIHLSEIFPIFKPFFET